MNPGLMISRYFPTLLPILVLAASHTATANTGALKPGDALTIGDVRYSVETLEILHKSALRDDPDMTLAEAARLLIDNHLLADLALTQVPEKTLLSHDDRVGFPGEVALEDEYSATGAAVFHRELTAAIQRLPGKSLESTIIEQARPTPEQLRKTLDLGPRQEFQLDEAGLAKASQMLVLSYRFPGGDKKIMTLADIYRRQNVQGRIALHGGDSDFLAQQARQRLGLLYVDHWLERQSGLKPDTLRQIRRALRERALKDRYLAYLGLGADVHDDHDHLKHVAESVRPEEIRAYYRQHRDQFTRVAKARGHHIELPDEASAEQVYQSLRQGMAFSEAVRRYSINDDKNAADPGATGWVENIGDLPWRDTLLLILPEKQLSRPFKAPVEGDRETAHWEIVRVDERLETFQDEDSEGVRYQASRAIAERRIQRDYEQARLALYTQTPIAINRQLLPDLKIPGDAHETR